MKKLSKNLVGMVMLLVLLVLLLAGVYMFGMWHFKTHFFGGTKINGVSVGELTVDDAKYLLQNELRNYTLTCEERDGSTETITGDEIYMQYVDDGSLQKIMDGQKTGLWLLYMGIGKNYKVPMGFTYDKNSIDSVLDDMKCMDAGTAEAPTDSAVVDNGTSFEVSESTQGDTLDREATKMAIISAIENCQTTISFDKLNLYETPSLNSDSATLQGDAQALNKMLETKIVYDFSDRTYTVDAEIVRNFLTRDGNGSYSLDTQKVRDWVADMAYDTDTYGLSHQFTTTSGKTITLEKGGDYGWCINQEATVQTLLKYIQNGTQDTVKPIYTYTAKDRSTNDIGGTYVEVCIEKQEMWCYKDGVLVVDTPVITGNHAAGLDTPSGSVWAIDGKKADAVFTDNGGVKVKYWLPFVDSCGIHDASWRTEAMFQNKELWKTNGSDGCVNTPTEAAGEIFNVMDVGYPVIVYYSEDQPVGTQPVNEILPG